MIRNQMSWGVNKMVFTQVRWGGGDDPLHHAVVSILEMDYKGEKVLEYDHKLHSCTQLKYMF